MQLYKQCSGAAWTSEQLLVFKKHYILEVEKSSPRLKDAAQFHFDGLSTQRTVAAASNGGLLYRGLHDLSSLIEDDVH